jgi:hypothetical protein
MPTSVGEQVHNEGQFRHFFIPGEATPSAEFLYAGVQADYMYIPSVTIPSAKGDISPINIQSPFATNTWLPIGEESSAPDFPSFTATFMPRKGGVPRELYGILSQCDPVFFQSVTECSDPSLFLETPADYVVVLAASHHVTTTQGGGGGQSSAAVNHQLQFKPRRVYLLGEISFAQPFGAIPREVVAVAYGNTVDCGDCGLLSDGSVAKYAVVINVTDTTPPDVRYKIGNNAPVMAAITGADNNDVPTGIAVIGKYLVVSYKNASPEVGYYYAEIDQFTGIPGAFTKVTAGFDTAAGPNDIYVFNAREVFFAGDGGFIYKSTNIPAGVEAIESGGTTAENLTRIKGLNKVILAVGATDALLVSTNRGRSFAAAATAPGIANGTAVEAQTENVWWVGDSAGLVRYSENAGRSWATKLLDLTVATIADITFINREVGFIAGATATPVGHIFTTPNGGITWANDTSNSWRLKNWLAIDRINRIVYPRVANESVAVNNILAGGLADDGTAGVILGGITNLV